MIFCFLLDSTLCACVHSVDIDAEHPLVMVSGRVDSATLIRKLVRSGKHAELWPLKPYQGRLITCLCVGVYQTKDD